MTYTIEFNSDKILRDVYEAVDLEITETALAIENDTKADAPVRGGHRSFQKPRKYKGRKGKQAQVGGALRRSYTTTTVGQEGDPTGARHGKVTDGMLYVGSWLGYSYYVERGTSKMIARPHFQPAIDKNIPLRGARFRRRYAAIAPESAA